MTDQLINPLAMNFIGVVLLILLIAFFVIIFKEIFGKQKFEEKDGIKI